MTYDDYQSFVLLRKQNKIGRIWPSGSGFLLAPLIDDRGTPVIEGCNDYALAEFIGEDKLLAMIDKLSGKSVRGLLNTASGLDVQRKEAGRELHGADSLWEQECRKWSVKCQ